VSIQFQQEIEKRVSVEPFFGLMSHKPFLGGKFTRNKIEADPLEFLLGT